MKVSLETTDIQEYTQVINNKNKDVDNFINLVDKKRKVWSIKNTNLSVSVPFVAGVGPEPTTSGL